MLHRTTPRRLTFIVLALILGILLGLALFPPGDISGAAQAGFCDSVSQIPQAECLALEALYNSTNGSGWTDNSGWLVTNTPCTTPWHGITCATGNVWKIDLTENLLSGPLPTEIGDFSQLQALLLSKNGLTGPIPSQLGKLTNLIRLNLSFNQLSGSIPTELGALTQLQNLSFAYNDLTGEIPVQIGLMSSLQLVELISNTLEGPIPTVLGNLPNLGYLDLSSNKLTGTIPAELALPVDLSTLLVESNGLEGEVPAGLCNNLVEAKLGYNKLDTLNPDACLENLESIDNWEATQTVPPTDLVATSPTAGEVQLNWTVVTQLVDLGYYEVLYSQTSGGPYSVHGSTANKITNSYTITNLDPNTELFFVVRTVTPAHDNNQSDLISINSSEAPTTPNAITLAEFQVNRTLPYFAVFLATALILLSAGTIFYLIKRA